MKYLYGNMPYSDMGNYSFETFLDYALHGVTLWEESQEVRELSEEMYLNYVLYHRINEEEITPCRSFFCAQLKNRLQGMSSREAALEVNYWCAQEATYQSTDDRTLSPMTVYRRGNGRCGEESTFTVSALRSVGIPARQVYVPKWSHCDDNHAWVEVWCDGKWGFMGACEPEPILNKGWFTNASSRAMMVNSRWFDSLKPTEEIIGQSGMVTMVNQLQRYAKAEEIIISVKDIDGQPVQGANVVFEILNYSEFSQIAETATDEHGIARLTTGLGSICIRVRKEEKYAERMMNTKGEKECDIVLEVSPVKESWQPFDMIAPKDAPVNTNMPTKEQRKEGNVKEAKATQKRRTKVETSVWKEREDFLNKEKSYGPLRKGMLRVLTEKDQTDCICSVLEEHLQYALAYQKNMDQELFVRYVLNPRIADEVLTKYRESIEGAFTEEQKQIFRQQPKRIWEYIKENIHACKEKERDSLITVPAALLKLRVGSERSQKVLFVAIARTLGIPARLHFADGEMEYFTKGEFHRISQAAIKNCTLVLEKEGVD
ncbi:MAG: transglutaminase domain-containing protein, partial [Lachnospiraceae bacterium]